MLVSPGVHSPLVKHGKGRFPVFIMCFHKLYLVFICLPHASLFASRHLIPAKRFAACSLSAQGKEIAGAGLSVSGHWGHPLMRAADILQQRIKPWFTPPWLNSKESRSYSLGLWPVIFYISKCGRRQYACLWFGSFTVWYVAWTNPRTWANVTSTEQRRRDEFLLWWRDSLFVNVSRCFVLKALILHIWCLSDKLTTERMSKLGGGMWWVRRRGPIKCWCGLGSRGNSNLF